MTVTIGNDTITSKYRQTHTQVYYTHITHFNAQITHTHKYPNNNCNDGYHNYDGYHNNTTTHSHTKYLRISNKSV